MSFIKAQKVVRNADGRIISGSAAIVDAVYVNTGQKNHSRHVVRESKRQIIGVLRRVSCFGSIELKYYQNRRLFRWIRK